MPGDLDVCFQEVELTSWKRRGISVSGPSRRTALSYELGRYRSKADVVTSHMTPPGL